MPTLGRHVPAEQEELGSLLIRGVIEQAVAHGREPDLEVGLPDSEPVQFGERAVELVALHLKVEGYGVAVGAEVANGRVSDGDFPELMLMDGLAQSGERILLAVATSSLHVEAQQPDLLVLMMQDIDDVG